MGMNPIPIEARRELAKKSGIGDDYLYQLLTRRKVASLELCIILERESQRAVTCEELRPDVDWAYLRGVPPGAKPNQAQTRASQAQAAIKTVAQGEA